MLDGAFGHQVGLCWLAHKQSSQIRNSLKDDQQDRPHAQSWIDNLAKLRFVKTWQRQQNDTRSQPKTWGDSIHKHMPWQVISLHQNVPPPPTPKKREFSTRRRDPPFDRPNSRSCFHWSVGTSANSSSLNSSSISCNPPIFSIDWGLMTNGMPCWHPLLLLN